MLQIYTAGTKRIPNIVKIVFRHKSVMQATWDKYYTVVANEKIVIGGVGESFTRGTNAGYL